jgi:hypothetical protein
MQQITWAQGSFQPSPCLQLEQGKLLVVGTRQDKNEGIFVCVIRGAIVLISRHEKLTTLPHSLCWCLEFSRKMPCCRLGPSQMLRMCTPHQSEQEQQTRNLNNRANDFFWCALPAFSPAQLSSTDPEQPTIKNARDLPQITFVRTEKKG